MMGWVVWVGRIASGVGQAARSVPAWLWAFAVGLALGAVGHHYVNSGSGGERPNVTTKEPREISEVPADPFDEWWLHKVDTARVIDTTCSVIPREVLSGSGGNRTQNNKNGSNSESQNGLPEVTYDTDLLGKGPDLASAMRLDYAILPLRRGRPTVNVGPDVFEVYGTNPNTGAGFTWRYEVLRPAWTLSAVGQARGLLAPSASAGLRLRRFLSDHFSLSVAPTYGAYCGPSGTCAAGLGVQAGVQWRALSWGRR